MVCPPDGLSQQHTDVNGLDLTAPLLVDVVHDCVSHQNLHREKMFTKSNFNSSARSFRWSQLHNLFGQSKACYALAVKLIMDTLRSKQGVLLTGKRLFIHNFREIILFSKCSLPEVQCHPQFVQTIFGPGCASD